MTQQPSYLQVTIPQHQNMRIAQRVSQWFSTVHATLLQAQKWPLTSLLY
jgi:hypothetical protein